MKTNTLDFDAQALRERILDLAMRGKLVPQDPNDKPASVLLEKIKAEKEELVKEKKIKKSKPLPAITDDEKPFDIPNSWEWVRLGDAINLVSGRDIPKKNHLTHPQEKSMPYITGASNINEEGKITITEWVNNPSVVVNQGTLLLSVKGTIGKTAVLNIPCAHIARQIMGIENIYNLDDDYQKYYLQSYVGELQKKAKSMIPGISREDLLLAIFPLPPLSEQSRIAAKIAQLFALLRKVESSTQQYAKLQTLLKSKVLDLAIRGKLVKQDPNDEPASVLLEKIKAEKAELVKEKKIKKSKPLPPITDEEKPFDIPDSWEWVRLGKIVSYQNGYAYKSSELVKVRKGLPVIKSQNIMTLKVIIKDNNDYVKEPNEKMLNSKIIKGDLLMCLSSQSKNPEPLGKTAIYDLDKPALLNQRVLKLKLINHSMTDLIYYFINSSWFHFTVSHRGSGSGQSNLKLGDVMNMPIPVPPLNEEKHIVNRIEVLFKKLSN